MTSRINNKIIISNNNINKLINSKIEKILKTFTKMFKYKIMQHFNQYNKSNKSIKSL